MQISSRFTMAIHMFACIDVFKDMKMTSDFMAASIGTNPVIIRKLLQQLKAAGLIEVFKQRPDLTALLDLTWPEPPEDGSELYTLPNIHLSSHIAGSKNDEVHRMADYMIEEYKRFADGKPLMHEVTEKILMTL